MNIQSQTLCYVLNLCASRNFHTPQSLCYVCYLQLILLVSDGSDNVGTEYTHLDETTLKSGGVIIYAVAMAGN